MLFVYNIQGFIVVNIFIINSGTQEQEILVVYLCAPCATNVRYVQCSVHCYLW